MAGGTAGETAGGTVNRVERSIFQVRCKGRNGTCRARLFDARREWTETSIRDAQIAVRCWRCKRVVGLIPKV